MKKANLFAKVRKIIILVNIILLSIMSSRDINLLASERYRRCGVITLYNIIKSSIIPNKIVAIFAKINNQMLAYLEKIVILVNIWLPDGKCPRCVG